MGWLEMAFLGYLALPQMLLLKVEPRRPLAMSELVAAMLLLAGWWKPQG